MINIGLSYTYYINKGLWLNNCTLLDKKLFHKPQEKLNFLSYSGLVIELALLLHAHVHERPMQVCVLTTVLGFRGSCIVSHCDTV
jgi:hypothetical protein